MGNNSKTKRTGYLLLVLFGFLVSANISGQRRMEFLDRGVVAIRSENNTAFISWRLLGDEPWNIGFNVYRSENFATPVKLNDEVLYGGTNYSDQTANFAVPNRYFVAPVIDGEEQFVNSSFTLSANAPVRPFFLVPINKTQDYRVYHIWVGDLNADGKYDFVFTKMPSNAADPILVEAYLQDGTFLWQLDCGPNSLNRNNISPGSSALSVGHGDNITVFDMNGNGRSEVIVRTANGVKFGDGGVLTHANNSRQFISVLDGMTGAEIARGDVPTDVIEYGPMNGHMGIAYLDGVHPSVVWSSKNRRPNGHFEMMVTAWTLDGNHLDMNWKFIRSNQYGGPDGHNIRIADVDGDGRDEVIPFGFCLNHDGSLSWSLGDHGVVHGDRFHIGKMDPDRPGLQGYMIQQDQPQGLAWVYFDAGDATILQSQYRMPPADYARGIVGDFDPRYPGYEFWTFTDRIYNISGQGTSTNMPSGAYPNLRIWWTGDLLSENLDGVKFTKWDYNNSTLNRIYTAPWEFARTLDREVPAFYGDILGDWREEVVYESNDQNYLVIYTTPYPTDHRIYTLPHNPKYRLDMTVRGYFQSHNLDYYLGHGMQTPPVPDIMTVCPATSLVPQIRVNTDPWVQTDNVSVTVGERVIFNPMPVSGGTWRWQGPSGFESTLRAFSITDIQEAQGGEYTAFFKNNLGCESTLVHSVNVQNVASAIKPQVDQNKHIYIANNKLVINGVENYPVTLNVYDLSGVVVFQQIVDRDIEIPLNILSIKRVYILTVSSLNNSLFKQLIVN